MGKSFWALTFIGLLLLTMLTWSVSRLLSGKYLVDQLRGSKTYDRLLDNPSIWREIQAGNLSENQIKNLISQSITPDIFYGFAEGYLTAFTDWLTGRSPNLNYAYDMSNVKRRAKEAVAGMILSSYDNLPDCQSTQLKSWSFGEGMPECRLAGTSSSSPDIERLANQQAEEIVTQLPEQVEIKETARLNAFRGAVSRLLWGFRALWGVTAVWLLLFLLVQRRKAFFTLGLALLFSGLIAVGFNFFLWDWLTKTITDYLTGISTIQNVLPLLNDLIGQLIASIKTFMGVCGISCVVLGLGNFVLAVFLRRRRLEQARISLN